MLKKITALFLSALMLLSLSATSFASDVVSAGKTLISDTFDDKTIGSEWTQTTSLGSSYLIYTANDGWLKLGNNSSSVANFSAAVKRKFEYTTESDTVSLSFDLYKDSETGYYGMLIEADDGTPIAKLNFDKNNSHIIKCASSGYYDEVEKKWKYTYTDITSTLPLKTWTNIRLDMNMKTHMFDFYVGGVRINKDSISFVSKTGTALGAVEMTQSQLGYLGIDNVKLSELTVDPTAAITFESVKGDNSDSKNITSALNLTKNVSILGETYQVEWKSSNDNVVSNDGNVTPGVMDEIVRLTAMCGNYTKNITVVVPINGNVVFYDDFESYTVGNTLAESGYFEGYTSPSASFTIAKVGETNAAKTNRTANTGTNSYYSTGSDEPKNYKVTLNKNAGILHFSSDVMLTSADNIAAIRIYRVSQNADDMTLRLSVDSLGNLKMQVPMGSTGMDRWMNFGEVKLNKWFRIGIELDLDNKSFKAMFEQDGRYCEKYSQLVTDNNRWDRKQVFNVGWQTLSSVDGLTNGKSEWYTDNIIIKNITSLTEAQSVAIDKKLLVLPEYWDGDYSVLPTRGINGNSTITWSSDDASIVANDGTPTFKNAARNVNLTATITKGETKATKVFNVSVVGKNVYGIASILFDNGKNNPEPNAKLSSVNLLMDVNDESEKTVIVAQFVNGALDKTAVKKVSANGEATKVLSVLENEFIVPSDISNYEIKVFMLDSNDTLVPLAKNYSNDTAAQKLFILGDSIATNYDTPEDKKSPKYQVGWGQVIGDYLLSSISIENYARGGFTTKEYFYEERHPEFDWKKKILPQVNEGDYVMVALAINDSGRKWSKQEYKERLMTIANDSKEKGAEPIFVTPTVKTTDGELSIAAGEYSDWMREAADECGAVLVDLESAMLADFTAYKAANGLNALKNMYFCSFNEDYLHINNDGAHYVAAKIVELLKNGTNDIKNYIR